MRLSVVLAGLLALSFVYVVAVGTAKQHHAMKKCQEKGGVYIGATVQKCFKRESHIPLE